jgi:hypothetical protein
MSKATIVCIALSFVAACATGGQEDPGGTVQDAAAGPHDASNVTTPVDAPKVRMDGGVVTPPQQDAQVSQLPPDAAPQTGPFCTANAQCTNAGECCVTLGGPQGFCGPGTVVFGECFPQ